jgi:glyoxylase-like metal-dependent hydrolase (beta-lactamase superfamily II)
MFRGTGSRRTLPNDEATAVWAVTPGADPVQVPGDRWPSRVDMELVNLTDGIYVVQGVRTGFDHLVVETDTGLVVADAPAGWVELHQFPPVDMVPGLGVSGLSEGLIDFLGQHFPDEPVRAVALTHHHDDHAGGARAFAAAGAAVYAPAEVADFLETALNRDSMPPDRLTAAGNSLKVLGVPDSLTLDDPVHPVRLINMGSSPHAVSSLGVLAGGYFFESDLHVPNSDADEPRTERAVTECWFAGWAVSNLPADTIVINSHRSVQTPVSRLARYLESPLCSGAAVEP